MACNGKRGRVGVSVRVARQMARTDGPSNDSLSLSLSLRLPLSLYQNRHTCLYVCVFLYLFVYYSPKSERKRGGETERDSIISPSVPGGISSYCYYNTITFSDIMVMRAYNSCLR